MNIPKYFKQYFEEFKNPRYRDRRSFYASSLSSNMRDLYWEMTGEPATNLPDYKSQFKMKLGKWIEEGLVKDIIRNLHWFGLHAMGEGNDQIPIGFSNPNVDGNLDSMLCERIGDKFSKPVVLEIKTTYGIGGDMLLRAGAPKEEHLAQVGAYLMDLSTKGVTDEGIILYIILSDNNFAEVLQFDCKYANGEIVTYKVTDMSGESKELDIRRNIKELVDRLETLKQYMDKKELPPPEHFYKKPLTDEFLASTSDNDLRKAIEGDKILGDWQIRYSKYFSKHLKEEGSSREYTPEEIELLRSEYEHRHPKTRKYKKATAE